MCSHYGDLGNITADGKGVAKVDMTDKLVTIVGKDSVVGRTIVVSSKVVVKHPGLLKTTPHIFSYVPSCNHLAWFARAWNTPGKTARSLKTP